MNFSNRMGKCCRDSALCLSSSHLQEDAPHYPIRLEKSIPRHETILTSESIVPSPAPGCPSSSL